MADRSIKRPVGVLFDLLVKVDRFLLKMDFLVLDCEIDQDIPIILGRPFLASGIAIVDTDLGEMKFCIQNDEVSFQLCKTKKQPIELQMVFVIDIVHKEVDDRYHEDPT